MTEPLFNFEKGEFEFLRGGEVKLVTGREELKNQIRKITHTALGRYEIYRGSTWGTRLEELLVGKNLPREYVTAEVERCIKEAICTLDGVERVDSFEVSHTGSRLKISYRVHSIYGDIDEETERVL